MMKDDLDLFERWAGGDTHAGEILVGRHYNGIFYFFATKVGEEIAEELTQDVFETICSKAGRLRLSRTFSSYLYGIARWKLVEYQRRRNRRKFDPITDSCEVMVSPSNITAIMTARSRKSQVVTALRRLSLDDQILLELKYYEEMSVPEIAEVLGESSGRVYALLNTARRRLQREVRKDCGGTDTVTTLAAYMKKLRAQFLERLEEKVEEVEGDDEESGEEPNGPAASGTEG